MYHMEFDFEKYGNAAIDAVVSFAPNFFMAIAAFVIGFWLVKKYPLLQKKH